MGRGGGCWGGGRRWGLGGGGRRGSREGWVAGRVWVWEGEVEIEDEEGGVGGIDAEEGLVGMDVVEGSVEVEVAQEDFAAVVEDPDDSCSVGGFEAGLGYTLVLDFGRGREQGS